MNVQKNRSLKELVAIAEEVYTLFDEKYNLTTDEIEEVGNLIWQHITPRLRETDN